jgi:ketosteroid isomerase-like protein
VSAKEAAPSTADLASATQLLLDRIAISELTARYNRAADGTDASALTAVFTADATVVMRGNASGDRSYTGSEFEQLVAPNPKQRVHMTTDAVIEIDGDRATQVCTLLLCTRSRRRKTAALFTGVYRDELLRTSAGWRFQRREADMDFVNEAHMTLANLKDQS